MKNKMTKIKILVFILVLVFYGSLLVHKINLHWDDQGRHLQNGKIILSAISRFDFGGENMKIFTKNFYSYTEPDFPFINDYWLSSVVFYSLYSIFGFSGLVIFATIVLLFAFSLLFFVATKKADFWLVAALSIPTVSILWGRTDVRPEMFSYLFIAVFLYLLTDFERHPEHKRIFFLIPLQILWVNMHTFFFVGVMLVGGFLTEKIILNWKNLRGNPLVKKLTLLLVALIIACLINPNGLGGTLRPVTRFTSDAVYVTDSQPLLYLLKIKPVEDIPIIIFIPMVFLLALSFFFSLKAKAKTYFYYLASIGAIIAGFAMVRTLPFFGFIFLPAASANFNGNFHKSKDWLKNKWPKTENILGKVLILALIVALFYLIFLGIRGKIPEYNEFGLGLKRHANSAATFFKEQGLHGPILNDPGIGSYLIWHLFPKEKVFFDNRHADAYSSHFIHDIYQTAMQTEEGWKKTLATYQFNAIFFWQYDKVFDSRRFLGNRMRDPEWATVYADNNAVILLRNNAENREIIKRFSITQDNVEEKMKYLLESQDIDDWLAAGDIFNLIGRSDLTLSAFQKAVLKQPEKRRVWMIMGEIEVYKDDFPSIIRGISYLEKAINLGQETAAAYSFLGLGYLKTGQYEKAEQALQKSLKINPEWQDAKDYYAELQKYLNQ